MEIAQRDEAKVKKQRLKTFRIPHGAGVIALARLLREGAEEIRIDLPDDAGCALLTRELPENLDLPPEYVVRVTRTVGPGTTETKEHRRSPRPLDVVNLVVSEFRGKPWDAYFA